MKRSLTATDRANYLRINLNYLFMLLRRFQPKLLWSCLGQMLYKIVHMIEVTGALGAVGRGFLLLKLAIFPTSPQVLEPYVIACRQYIIICSYNPGPLTKFGLDVPWPPIAFHFVSCELPRPLVGCGASLALCFLNIQTNVFYLRVLRIISSWY